MWERFTEKARRVIVLAQEEATRLKHLYVNLHMWLYLALAYVLLLAFIIPSGTFAGDKKLPSETLKLLKAHIEFNESIKLFQKFKNRKRIKDYLSKNPHYEYITSEEQVQDAGKIIFDDYKIKDDEKILAIYLISTDEIPIGIGFTLKPDADQLGKKLVLKALESEDAPSQWPVSTSKLYFLGSYPASFVKEVRVLLREGSMTISDKEVNIYNIEYYFIRE